MELIGYLGGVLLTICGVPEVIRTLKYKFCHLGWSFLILWFLGEIFMLIYSIHIKSFPLIMNYFFNLLIVGIMLFYKIKK